MTAGVFNFGPSAVSNIAIHIDYKDFVRPIDFAEVQLFKLALLLPVIAIPSLCSKTDTKNDMSA